MSVLVAWVEKAARERGGSTALVYRDTYLSWRGLAHRVQRRANELKAFGIGPGAWVGVMLGNVPDLVILTLAVAQLGAVPVPLDPALGNRDLDILLDVAPLRALVTRPHGDAPTSSAAPRHAPESRRRLQGTLLNLNLFRSAPISGAATTVLFTSDAGGDPKGVVRGPDETTAIGRMLTEGLGITPDDQILALSPLHRGYGFDLGLIAALYTGATLHLEDELSDKRLAKTLLDSGITVVAAGPAIYGTLAREITGKPLIRPNLRFISSGSPLPPTVADAFFKRYGVHPLSLYHCTETGPVCLDRSGLCPTTVGSPLHGVDLRLGSEGIAPLASGPMDRLWLRSPAIAQSFVPALPSPMKTAATPIGHRGADGWFRTGDLGQMTTDGVLTLHGRDDDLVKVDGKRVALGEVAASLESSPKVKQADVRVATDEFGAPFLVARVTPTGPCSQKDLIDHCVRLLAPHKVPRQVEFEQG